MYAMGRSSAIRMIKDTIIPAYSDQVVQYYDWDSHAEKLQLPNKDLFGLSAFSMSQFGQFHDVTFAVGIMTSQDMNIHRLVGYVDMFYKRLQAQERFKIYNPDGTEAGFDCVIFDGTEAAPLTRVDARPTQTLSCRGRLGVAGFVIPDD